MYAPVLEEKTVWHGQELYTMYVVRVLDTAFEVAGKTKCVVVGMQENPGTEHWDIKVQLDGTPLIVSLPAESLDTKAPEDTRRW